MEVLEVLEVPEIRRLCWRRGRLADRMAGLACPLMVGRWCCQRICSKLKCWTCLHDTFEKCHALLTGQVL